MPAILHPIAEMLKGKYGPTGEVAIKSLSNERVAQAVDKLVECCGHQIEGIQSAMNTSNGHVHLRLKNLQQETGSAVTDLKMKLLARDGGNLSHHQANQVLGVLRSEALEFILVQCPEGARESLSKSFHGRS